MEERNKVVKRQCPTDATTSSSWLAVHAGVAYQSLHRFLQGMVMMVVSLVTFSVNILCCASLKKA